MRLSVNLDPEVHEFLSAYSKGKGITVSAAINELLRIAEQSPNLGAAPCSEHGRVVMNEYGYLEVVVNEVLTTEMVKEFSEDPIV